MLLFRNVFGLIAILPLVLKGMPGTLRVNNLRIVILRSIMGLLNLLFIFLAIQQISLVNTTLLSNSAPFFVPILVWFWLKKTIDNKIWPAIFVGFVGIVVILQPDRRIFNFGALYGLLSGMCLAMTIITMRISSRTEKLTNFLLYFFLIGLIATLPFAIFNWKIESWHTLIGLLSIGLFSFLGQILLFYGLREGKAHQLAPFAYVTVIFSGIYEWLIWGHVPQPIAYLGMVLIIGAGAWIVWFSRIKKIE